MQLDHLTIAQALQLFELGDLSATSLCQAYLDRIDSIDRSGPTLKSISELNPDALRSAEACDRARLTDDTVPPLNGIPILVKDSIDTSDRTMTTAGSIAMIGNFAPRDAFVVDRLRKAGALILGKANMTEWSYMRSARTCSGWSSRGRQIRNPHVLDRSPSGSSGGSAVAVAAGLCMGALGAEVDGSIVRPSSANGVVGIKPTVGLVSRSGVMPVAEPQDTVGPIARTVADVARLKSAFIPAPWYKLLFRFTCRRTCAPTTAKVEGDAGILKQLASTMVVFDPRFEIMPGTKAMQPEVTGYVESGIPETADPYQAIPRQTIAE